MPQVASESKTHALNRPLPHSVRPAPANDHAAATPFESLLDDSAPAPPERPAQPAADDKASPAAQPQPAQPSANAQNGKTPKLIDAAKSDAAGKVDNTGKAAIDPQATGDDKAAIDPKIDVKIDAKIAVQSAGEDVKPASDGKPADSVTPDGLAPAPAADPIQIAASADAIATVVAPAPDAVAQAAPVAAIAQAAPVAENAVIVAAGTPKAKPDIKPDKKPDTLAAPQADADAAPEDAKLPVKAALHADGKPQPAASDADKDGIANARGEVAASNHRAATADAPATISADTNAAAPKTSADAAQPTALTAPTHSAPVSAANAAPAAAPAPQAAAIPLAGVAIEIASKALAGKNHFEIRLDPPELGRIEVHLDVDRDGNVTSRLIADRSDTLDLLRRDSADLERALQDAGLKTSDNGLQFSLRDQSDGQQQTNSGAATARLVVDDETLARTDLTPRLYSRLAGQGGGIDIQV